MSVAGAESVVFARLKALTDLAPLVGLRIFPDEADPDEATPLIVYSVPAVDPIRDLSGKVSMVRSTVIVEAYGDTKDVVRRIGDIIKEGMDGVTFDGAMRAYMGDRSTEKTDDGYSESLTFGVLQQ